MKLLCMLKLHKWHYSPDGMHRYCERCGKVQDYASDGLDHDWFYLKTLGRHGGWG
jgi:hypothetical protein